MSDRLTSGGARDLPQPFHDAGRGHQGVFVGQLVGHLAQTAGVDGQGGVLGDQDARHRRRRQRHEPRFAHRAFHFHGGTDHGAGELRAAGDFLRRSAGQQDGLDQFRHRHHAALAGHDVHHVGAELRDGRVLGPAILELTEDLPDPRPGHFEQTGHVGLAGPEVALTHNVLTSCACPILPGTAGGRGEIEEHLDRAVDRFALAGADALQTVGQEVDAQRGEVQHFRRRVRLVAW